MLTFGPRDTTKINVKLDKNIKLLKVHENVTCTTIWVKTKWMHHTFRGIKTHTSNVKDLEIVKILKSQRVGLIPQKK